MCSIVEYYGSFGKASCGYCKAKKAAESAGMTAHFLSVDDYQNLIDRGWRRSGKYCYKPSNTTTCCPSYTIRCDLQEFVLSKSHKKILKTMNKFLRDGIRESAVVDAAVDPPVDGDQSNVMEKEYQKGATRNLAAVNMDTQGIAAKQADKLTVANGTVTTAPPPPVVEGSAPKSDHGNPKKKKLLRLERRQAKLLAKGLAADPVPSPTQPSGANPRKTLAEFLSEEPKDGKHKLKVILVPSNSDPNHTSSFALYVKYQTTVHKDPPSKLKPENYKRFLCSSPLKVKLVLSSTKAFKDEHGAREFDLYRRYQLHVHNDKVGGISEFYNFLVESPLKPEDTQTEHTLGSFHQQYWLDDKLIAVAVIDILPHCLSSVYFFYDPDYGFLSLGTYSSLRELAFVEALQKDLPDLRYYYMGFYIHSCAKMRYKARLAGSYLLCPEAYTWHRIDERLLGKLDKSKYSRFNEDGTVREGNEVGQEDLKRILMYNNGQPIPLEQYLRKCKDSTVFVRAHEYAKLVGKVCARRIVLYL